MATHCQVAIEVWDIKDDFLIIGQFNIKKVQVTIIYSALSKRGLVFSSE